jgi:hypothetical protein
MKELMIDLEKLLDMEQFQELFNVLAENGEFNYSENGLNISAKSSDNALQLQVSYETPKQTAKSEAQDFQKFIETIDDDLFTDVCESLGGEQLSRIANCLNSDDVESVRSGALRFKQEMRNVLVKKINFYTECLNNLDK